MESKLKIPFQRTFPSLQSPSLAFLLLGAAVFSAYFRVLGNGFVLDDFLHIVTRPEVVDAFAMPKDPFGRELTYGIWRCVFLAFGHDPLPFHVLGLLVHLGSAFLVFMVAGRLLPCLWSTHEPSPLLPAASALLFALHPLASEGVAYAAQLSIQLVTFFSLLAVYALLRWSQSQRYRWLSLLLVASTLASISKQPGFFHLAFNLFFVAAVIKSGPRDRWLLRWSKTSIPLRVAMVAAVSAILYLIANFWIERLLFRNEEFEKIFAYWLTQSRVIYEYLWRIIIPINLSADHFVPWTVSTADTAAVVAFGVVILGVIVISVGVLRFRSPVFMFAGLILSHLIIRLLYPVDEILVEYRVYPSMPWISIALAVLLSRAALLLKIPPKARVAAFSCILAAFGTTTFLRTADWKDELTLTADVLETYPMNIRAVSIRLKELERIGNHEAVVAECMRPDSVAHEIRLSDEKTAPIGRQFSKYKTMLFQFRSYAPIARSLSALGRTEESLALADHLVRQSNPKGSTQVYWSSYYLRARIRIEAGLGQPALEDIEIIRRNMPPKRSRAYYDEIERMSARATALATTAGG